MADTLESLEIEVKHSASGAATELNNIATAISKIGGTLTRVLPKLAKFAETLGKISNSGTININDIHDSTFQKVTQSAAKAAKTVDNSPLSDSLREKIEQAGKLEIAVHKAAKAEEDMESAFQKGNENAAWSARERAINAAATVAKEQAKAAPKPEIDVPTALPQEMQDLISSASQIDILQAKLVSLRSAMQEAFSAGDADKAFAIRGQIIQTEKALERVERSARGTGKSFRELAKEATGAGSPLRKIVESLKRIAFYRIIRTVLKNVGQAFNEGLQAAYAFSSGIDGAGHRFAEAMDSIKSAGNAMKGQLGSAFISLYAAVAPILIALIDIITRVADAISQLLAAFTGSTYLKANKTASSWADNMQRGAGSAKEWKNQLLGFDEINRLNEPSSGGGGSGKNPLDGFDFDDAPIEEKWRKIADKVTRTIQWIEDHLKSVKSVAEAIGLAILAWKLGNFVNNLLGLGAPMSKILGIALAIGGAFLLIKGACDAWVNGVDWENLSMMIGGTAAAAIGLGLAFGAVGAAIGLLAGGILMLVVGFRDWIKTGELSTQTFYLLEGGIAAVGVALALLTGSWIPLVIAAVAGIALAVYKYWDDIVAFFSKVWNTIKEEFSSALESIKYQFSKDWGEIKAKAIEIWDSLSAKAEQAWNAISGFFVGGFEAARDKITEILGELSQWFDNTFGRLIGWCQAAHAWIQDVLNGLNLLGNANSSNWQNNLTQEDFLTGFASGGYPESGQLFFAREDGAGAELVGTVGGRTAVASNDDILSGIRQGVFEAVSAAMNGNASNSGDVNVRVYLDSREIKSGQRRLGMATGV